MKAVSIRGLPDVQAWADRVNDCLGKAVEQIVSAGRALCEAKDAESMNHGEWERMFKGHPQAVARPVPFGVRTAQRLMAIAEHPSLSKATHASLLPPSWMTLYELTQVAAPVLNKALTDGRIHPAMERREVAALRTNPKPVKKRATRPRSQPCGVKTAGDACYFDVEVRIRETYFDLPIDEREDLISSLRQLLDRFEKEGA